MKLPPNFDKKLQEKTDEELFDMLRQAADFLPEAIDAAKAELRKRNIAPETMAQLEKTKDSSNADHEMMAACGESPSDAPQMEDASLSLVILATARTVVEANLIRTLLEAAGIQAVVPEEYTPQILWNLVPSPLEQVTVRVAAKDYEAAKKALDETGPN